MITVLESIENREKVSSADCESTLVDEVIDRENQCFELGITPRKPKVEPGEDSLSLYFAEVGKTALLSDEEATILSRRIEDGRHLESIEKVLVAEHGGGPSALEVLLKLLERVSRRQSLFEALQDYLGLPSERCIAEIIAHPDFRAAIDDKIDSYLSDEVAKSVGVSESRVDAGLVELSLDSRLIPWHVLESVGVSNSLAELGPALQSPEFMSGLEGYSREIGSHFELIRERAREATNHMIRANLRLVVRVARGHMNWRVPLSDLIQEGSIGLMQAVRKFDHRRGYRFSTYAVPWIWQAINRAANDQSRVVRLPGYLVDDLTKVSRLKNDLVQKLGRQPTGDELASEMGVPSEKMESLLQLGSSGPASLEAPVGDEGSQLGDFIADRAVLQPEEEADASLLREELSRMLDSLTARERRVIELRFGLHDDRSRTLKEVGVDLGLTKERVRQIEKAALAKLRHPSHSRELIGYLG